MTFMATSLVSAWVRRREGKPSRLERRYERGERVEGLLRPPEADFAGRAERLAGLGKPALQNGRR